MTARTMFFSESKLFSDREERQAAREDLVYNVTEDILVAMESGDISKQELARRLGKSKAYVSQVLSGNRNMTLGTLSDIAYVLELKPVVRLCSAEQSKLVPRFALLEDEFLEKFKAATTERLKSASNVYKFSRERIIKEESAGGQVWCAPPADNLSTSHVVGYR